MTAQAYDALAASAALAVAGGLLAGELGPVVRYLAQTAQVKITAAEVGAVCAGALR